MSSFDGIIREFNVVVDFFRSSTYKYSLFFLSHCHTDHMDGLLGGAFVDHLSRPGVVLYCSEITSHFLISKNQAYSSLSDKIVCLQPNVPHLVQVHGIKDHDSGCQDITVSTIPAGHCPGSVMFLFEGKEKTVLYTGDFRILEGDIKKFKPLHSGNGVVKAINTLYLDTTFFSESHWSFPARDDSIKATCEYIKNWICKGLEYHAVIIVPAWTGTEYLFARVASCFKTEIHVLPDLHSILSCIPEICDAVTVDCSCTQIHAVDKRHFLTMRGLLSNFMKMKTINLSAARFTNTKYTSEMEWFKDGGSDASVCYSSHSSLMELEDVILHLKPLRVFPCVKPMSVKRARKTLETMMRKLGVHHVDLAIFQDDDSEGETSGGTNKQTFAWREMTEREMEMQNFSKLVTEPSPIMEKLIDSPPPKRKVF